MPGIFVSYRREQASGDAGRLHEALADRLGAEHVFMDVHIPPGLDFVEHLTRAVQECDVLLAVIGVQWVDARDAQGRRRLDDPNDFVRLAFETA